MDGNWKDVSMIKVDELNRYFGINDTLRFREDPSGLIVAEIKNGNGEASLCLQGAHLMRYRPADQAVPIVWLSEQAKIAPGKSIRGGAPVCWPWFGPHESEPSFPGHGYARTVPWRVIESGTEPNGATRITLRMIESTAFNTQWPHPSILELTAIVGDSLRVELVTENTGSSDFTIGEALHTYLQIGDIGEVTVAGLEDADYWDKVGDLTRRTQSGPISFYGETDRVYVNTESECIVQDARLKRNIRIIKSGGRSTVVWTPWSEKAEKMGDLGSNNGWRRMVCVESGNALDNRVIVPAGTKHKLIVEYSAESR
jgi:D-hexose-6-phosphate mutarotase